MRNRVFAVLLVILPGLIGFILWLASWSGWFRDYVIYLHASLGGTVLGLGLVLTAMQIEVANLDAETGSQSEVDFDGSPVEKFQALPRLKDQMARLSELVIQLRKLGELESRPIEPEPVRVDEILADLVEEFQTSGEGVQREFIRQGVAGIHCLQTDFIKNLAGQCFDLRRRHGFLPGDFGFLCPAFLCQDIPPVLGFFG